MRVEVRGRAVLGDDVAVVGVALGDQRLVDAGIALVGVVAVAVVPDDDVVAVAAVDRLVAAEAGDAVVAVAAVDRVDGAVPMMMSSPSPPLIAGVPAKLGAETLMLSLPPPPLT